MEQDKINKIVIEAVFGVLLIVPLVIGVSLYSRTSPLPPEPLPPVYTPPVYNPPQPVQNRFYVSGYAYNASSTLPFSNVNIKTDTGQNYPISNGLFTFPVSTSTSQLILSIEGFKPKTVSLGIDSPGMPYTQNLGSIFFEPSAEENAHKTSWLIYENLIFKYKIQYPTEWTILQSNNAASASSGSVGLSSIFDATPAVTILYYPDSASNSLDEYVKSYFGAQTVPMTRSDILVNNQPAIQLYVPSTDVTVTFMKRKTDNLVFNWSLWKNTVENHKIYDLMLEKFEY